MSVVFKENNYLISSIDNLDFLHKQEKDWIKNIVNPYTGIINNILQRDSLEDYGLILFQCLSANIQELNNAYREPSTGGMGTNFNERDAFFACIGEAIERYCMSFYDADDIVYARYSDIKEDQRIPDLSLYSSEQYKHYEGEFINPETQKVAWTTLQQYQDKTQSILYPASLVYLPFKENELVAETTSTGIASHIDEELAIISCITEIVERDAVMINFFGDLPHQLISFEEVFYQEEDKQHKNFLSKLDRDFNIRICKLYSDIGVPTFLSYIWTGEDEEIEYGIGACCELNTQQAIIKSLRECLFTYYYSRKLKHLKVNNKTEIKALYERFLYYQGDKFKKLLRPSEKIKYKKSRYNLEFLISELNKNSLNFYYKNVTTCDIMYNTKVRVFRGVIPGMIDLNKKYGYLRKNSRRYIEVPKKLGFDVKELLEDPHPFP